MTHIGAFRGRGGGRGCSRSGSSGRKNDANQDDELVSGRCLVRNASKDFTAGANRSCNSRLTCQGRAKKGPDKDGMDKKSQLRSNKDDSTACISEADRVLEDACDDAI